jgi:hypothetical protein
MTRTTAEFLPARRAFSPRVEWWVLWLLGCGGAIAFIEPSPYELLMMIALLVLLVGGARLAMSGVVMMALLTLFNIGGLFSLLPFLHQTDAIVFIAVSFYLAITSCFFAMLVQERTLERLNAIKWGCICGAVISSSAGIAGYFDIAGLAERFTLYGRASGTFKDPNVLGAFAVLPVVFLVQEIVTSGRLRLRLIAPLALILFGGVFLSFSRGAWGHTVASIGLMIGLTFLLVAGPQLRARIVILSLAGISCLILALSIIVSLEGVGSMFEQRASLSQSYDVGTTGRFGKQLQAIPALLDRPNGYGPLQFRLYWIEDPHNVYLNAFSSYGWLGGLSYMTLIASTIVVGWRTAVTRSPFQNYAIAIWSTLFVTILMGILIDTDHWRHFYMMLGLVWGLHEASRLSSRESPAVSRSTKPVDAASASTDPGLYEGARTAQS